MKPSTGLPLSFVIVIGGTGFIGSALSKRLLDLEIPHVIVSRKKPQNIQFSTPIQSFIQADVTDSQNLWVHDIVKSIQHLYPFPQIYLVHCGGLVNPTAKDSDFHLQNLVAVKNLILAAKTIKIDRFVHISSSSIYMGLSDRLEIRENEVDPQKIMGSYALSKWNSEQELNKESQADPSGFKIVALRPQLVYGLGERVFLPALLSQASSFGLPKTSPRGPITSMTGLNNLVDAILLSFTSTMESRMEIYNITDGQNINLLEAIEEISKIHKVPFRTFKINRNLLRLAAISAEKITRLMESSQGLDPGSLIPPITLMQTALLSTDRTLSIKKAKAELGYHPKRDTILGLKESLPK